MPEIIDQVLEKDIDLSKYPDPHTYDRNVERALWVMELVEKEFGIDRLKPSQIAKILTEKIEICTSPQAIAMALKVAKRGMVHKTRDGFKLMEKGRRQLFASGIDKPTVIMIEPGKPFTSKAVLFESVLSKLKGELRICDPYCGPRTLDTLSKLEKNKRVMVLTQKIEDKPLGNFHRVFKDFKKERGNVEIKLYDKSELHDRYIITEGEIWFMGHGLKDLGMKESFVIRLGKDIRDSMEEVFNRRWKNALALN
jgi:hypothetical protein